MQQRCISIPSCIAFASLMAVDFTQLQLFSNCYQLSAKPVCRRQVATKDRPSWRLCVKYLQVELLAGVST